MSEFVIIYLLTKSQKLKESEIKLDRTRKKGENMGTAFAILYTMILKGRKEREEASTEL